MVKQYFLLVTCWVTVYFTVVFAAFCFFLAFYVAYTKSWIEVDQVIEAGSGIKVFFYLFAVPDVAASAFVAWYGAKKKIYPTRSSIWTLFVGLHIVGFVLIMALVGMEWTRVGMNMALAAALATVAVAVMTKTNNTVRNL